jgi:uncharacterized protein YciI
MSWSIQIRRRLSGSSRSALVLGGPIGELSVYGEGASVAFENGEIVERASDGRQTVWGSVTRWEPGASVAFTWHPGRSSDLSSHVQVSFSAAEGKTLVTLEHSGWGVFDDPSAARDEYDHGWVEVLDRYRVAAGEDNDEDEDTEEIDTSVALLHRPGPNAPVSGSVFDDPQFGDHIGFLRRMRESGYLVAAGPLRDSEGEGMTILRLPGRDRFEEARVLATEDDKSVASGFFVVKVRPWQVVMSRF